MTSDDPLLSVSQIARLWGTGLDVVISLIDSRTLPSLDRGELIREGHLDVPLIRASWAEFMRVDSDGAGRILKPPEGASVHPALSVALGVHSALDAHDATALWALSSQRSRDGHEPESLLARWTEINGGGYPVDSGVGSTIYSLAPLPAVGARVFANAPRLPRAISKATPATLVAVLPLVWEAGEWKVDLPLYAGDDGGVFLPALLTSPAPLGVPLDPSRVDGVAPARSRPRTT
jgi:hypothetical protein